jgi:hypothetical protein
MRLRISLGFAVNTPEFEAKGRLSITAKVKDVEALFELIDDILGHAPYDDEIDDEQTEATNQAPQPNDEDLVIEGPKDREIDVTFEQTTGEGNDIEVVVTSGVPVKKFTVLQFPGDGEDDSPEPNAAGELSIEGPQDRTVTATFKLNDSGSEVIQVLVKSAVDVNVFLQEDLTDEGGAQDPNDDDTLAEIEEEDKAALFGSGTPEAEAFNEQLASATEAAIAADPEIQELLKGSQPAA